MLITYVTFNSATGINCFTQVLLLISPITPHQCTFEYPSCANLWSPSLNCTANLQFIKQQRSVQCNCAVCTRTLFTI